MKHPLFVLGAVVAFCFGPAAGQAQEREYKDSFKYYGPNGLWKTWSESQQWGRDTWIFWTGGNQKFLRLGTQVGGRFPISIEYYRMLDSRNRHQRFRLFGLINEPNCEAPKDPDTYGLWLDTWKGDPLQEVEPGDKAQFKGKYPYYPDPAAYGDAYGEPTGIVGLRKFKNSKFDESKWDRDR
jgi:hypothetical protein